MKQLSDEFDRYHADWKGAKVRFVNLTKKFTSSAAPPVHVAVTQAEASAQPTEEHASTTDDNQAAEDHERIQESAIKTATNLTICDYHLT